MRLFCLLAILAMFSHEAAAFGYCKKPTAPYCVDEDDTYESDSDFAYCKDIMQTYTKNINAYIECSNNALQNTIDETKTRLEKASNEGKAILERFNCKAAKKSSC